MVVNIAGNMQSVRGSLRMMWPFMRQHSALWAGVLFAVCGASVATLGVGVGLSRMVDVGLSGEAGADGLNRTAMELLIIVVGLALASYLRARLTARGGCLLADRLRESLFAHLLRLDPPSLSGNLGESPATLLITDIEDHSTDDGGVIADRAAQCVDVAGRHDIPDRDQCTIIGVGLSVGGCLCDSDPGFGALGPA